MGCRRSIVEVNEPLSIDEVLLHRAFRGGGANRLGAIWRYGKQAANNRADCVLALADTEIEPQPAVAGEVQSVGGFLELLKQPRLADRCDRVGTAQSFQTPHRYRLLKSLDLDVVNLRGIDLPSDGVENCFRNHVSRDWARSCKREAKFTDSPVTVYS